ncbi:MAG TPA: capsule assembly Wzi family protein [Longimicrobium sp.]|jgi:hypothetical protein
MAPWGPLFHRLARGSLAAAAASWLVAARPLAAQEGAVDVRGEVFVGSEMERYLRVLQVAGAAPLYPWTVRGLSTRELDRVLPADSLHPWARRYRLAADTARGLRIRQVRPRAQLFLNSSFPHGGADGPVWVGRGATMAVEGGVQVERGPLSLTLAPIAFVAQNAGFDLMPNGQDGPRRYADGLYPSVIDVPQRFGDGAYARVDPGQSTLRLDARGVALGISTANQQWGPASDNPILLGNNAPGFAHVFAGTARPANVWVGTLHGRLVWGSLRQTEWSPQVDGGRRFLAGAAATFSPRGAPGLELGGARIFHTPWPAGGLGADELLQPFQGLLKGGLSRDIREDTDSVGVNQLASVFFRWVHPRAGVELWGELARDDHSYDLRDFILEPDHESAYTLGGRKVWRDGARVRSFRAELLNARVTHLAQVRNQSPFYIHTGVRQGHTQRGQVLGSPVAFAGLGSVLGFDSYGPGGRWSVAWTQTVRDAPPTPRGVPSAGDGAEATHALQAERLFSRGSFDVTAGGAAVYQLNRNFADDAFNLSLTFKVSRGF